MNRLHKRAIKFLQKRFPRAPVLNKERGIANNDTGEVFKQFHPIIALDPDSGIKQRMLAVPEFGSIGEIRHLANTLDDLIKNIDQAVWTSIGNTNLPEGNEINTDQMVFSAKILIYTNKLCAPYSEVLEIFKGYGYLVEIIDEAVMFNTLFISYGGPDESHVSLINKFLKTNGIKTWFFPDDALPGQKLHRVMHEGVNNHDKVLLVCSKNSLSRPGVLNELERVLEREAKEGGSAILIPITLDNFVYSDWAHERPDLADQIKSRVITNINVLDWESTETQKQLNKLVLALTMK